MHYQLLRKKETEQQGEETAQIAERNTSASPKNSTILFILVDMHRNRNIVAADMKGAYLSAKIGKFIVIKPENEKVLSERC